MVLLVVPPERMVREMFDEMDSFDKAMMTLGGCFCYGCVLVAEIIAWGYGAPHADSIIEASVGFPCAIAALRMVLRFMQEAM